MVSAKMSTGHVGRRKLGFTLSALAAPMMLIASCGKLVGVGDTEVEAGAAGTGGASAATGGASVMNGGVSATTGGANAGTTGGSSTVGGTSAAGGGTPTTTGGKAGAQGGSGGSVGTAEGGDGTAGGADAGEGPGGAGTVTGGASAGGKGGATSTGGAGGKGGASAGGAGGKGGAGGATTGGAAGGAGTCSPACPLNQPVCQAGQCVVRGPTMVAVGNYYVDSTEVTVAQYKQFLAAKGSDTSNQPAVCSWNTTYYDTTLPMNPDTWPISNVDWCDATAFCSWAGKRLCGKSGGGAIAEADLFTPNVSQWFLACGGPNGGSHPNNDPVCNSNNGFGNLVPVATTAGCQGFYPGLYDLEGNVAEWVDGCAGNTGAADFCYLMGGGYFDSRSYCTEVYDEEPRSATANSFGFRCCSG